MRNTPFFSLVLLLASWTAAVDANPSLDEGTELRRIAEYWKEKDFSSARRLIETFLAKHPDSSYRDQLYAMLGDLHFKERDAKGALAAYEKIEGNEFQSSSQFRKIHCLYELKEYARVVAEAPGFLNNSHASPEELAITRFELAEALFHSATEENRAKYYAQAEKHYAALLGSKYKEMCLLPLAQIHTYAKEYKEAASYYLLLAAKGDARKEEWLFQAGSLEARYDKGKAIETFTLIAESGSKSAPQAAFNAMNLLFQEKRYADLLRAQDKLMGVVPEGKKPLMHYYIGKSLFTLGDAKEAAVALEKCLAAQDIDPRLKKNALLSLVETARATKDLLVLEKALILMKMEFPRDEETSRTFLLHAELCRENKEWQKARISLQELLEIGSEHPQKEAIRYDIAALLSEEEKWEESAAAFEDFLKRFPESKHKAKALRAAVHCHLEAVKTASNETLLIKKGDLATSLHAALEEKDTFSSEERKKLQYLLAQTYFALAKYEEAIEEMSNYLADYPGSADCYLLLAYAYKEGSSDLIEFALNAEKAFGFDTEIPDAADLHLTLFNTYLTLAERAPVDEKEDLIAKAADHLFCAGDQPIKIENLRWLAEYYYSQFEKGNQQAGRRATIVLEAMLGIDENVIALGDAQHPLEMEAEAIKLANLYASQKRFQERKRLLQALAAEHHHQPDVLWNYCRLALYELAKTHLALGEHEYAIDMFDALITAATEMPSYFATAAELEKAKVLYSLLKPEEKREGSEQVAKVCDALKTVQIRRKLLSEPLHLEAALAYVDIKTDLAEKEEQVKRRLFLLEQMRESFTSEEDPLVEQYLSAAEQFPEKEKLYQQYLTFIDAEMLLLEAKLEEGDQALQLQESAKNLLETLLVESKHDALTHRIQSTMEALQKT
ncbi:MAG: tetratricopeptide repeat protein [Verrucomicrobia bacterium]|nr:tetratricopeptide repeat protein [Verrucomicrobiota bacterium]